MNYTVYFDSRSKRVCSMSFNVIANSAKDAEAIATSILRQCGENPLNYKKPQVRQSTNELANAA